jgi:signal transduction histidine kinase
VHATDEFGILARRLTDLVERERAAGERRERETQERLKREYATLRVIGHHIRSPIQALLALNPPASSSWPYIERINKAVQAVFGGDALRDAFSRIYGEAVRVDLSQFLPQLAANAERIGVPEVRCSGAGQPVVVAVDDGALADAIVQTLNNANRYRTPGTPILITLSVADARATVRIENQGPQIAPQNLEDIFQFGVSIGTDSTEHQGQGLFVARELVARMHGSIRAENLPHGVAIEIVLPVVP